MSRDLFGHVTRRSISIGSRKWYTVPLSLISHSAIVLVLVAIPILAPAVMPSVFANDGLVVIHKIMPPPPPPPIRRADATPPPPEPSTGAPIAAPDGIHEEKPLPELTEPVSPSLIFGDVSDSEVLTPPPPPPPTPPPSPVRAGVLVRTPIKTHHVDPVYPSIAQAAGIQGIVIIEATIDETGNVINARVLRSVQLLDQAAINAVREWRFTPSQLNGRPVPVIMTVTVNFTLRR